MACPRFELRLVNEHVRTLWSRVPPHEPHRQAFLNLTATLPPVIFGETPVERLAFETFLKLLPRAATQESFDALRAEIDRINAAVEAKPFEPGANIEPEAEAIRQWQGEGCGRLLRWIELLKLCALPTKE